MCLVSRSSVESVKSEFTQVKNGIRKLQRQMETVEEGVRSQYKDFLEVGQPCNLIVIVGVVIVLAVVFCVGVGAVS